MRLHRLLIPLAAAALAACQTPPYQPPPPPPPQQPAPEPERPPEPTPPPPEPAPQPPAKQFRLGTATSALVAQARKQAAGGDFSTATTTLERALRIEPDNPLLWIEIGKVRMSEGNAAQADSMGRKALALGRGDPAVQADAWRLIAQSLRARGRNAEAADAEDRANALVPR